MVKISRIAKGVAIFALVSSFPVSNLFSKEVRFSYSNPADGIAYVGTKKAETYDIAILLSDPAFTGSKIVGIEVPVCETPNLANFSAWVSKELRLEAPEGSLKKVNATDLSVKATLNDGTISARFPEPMVIGADPLYVGYSFDVTAVEALDDTDPAKTPIAVTVNPMTGGLYVHTQRHYLKWNDRSKDLNGVSAMTVILDGDFPEVSGKVVPVRDVKCQSDEEQIQIPVYFSSYGSEPVSSLSFQYSYDGVCGYTEVAFEEPQDFLFGLPNRVLVTVPNKFSVGSGTLSLELISINGKDNVNSEKVADVNLSLVKLFPKKRPLVEEYTGLWCGFCPRGYVGMEMMAERYPDFIGVAIHNDDPMEVITLSEFPNTIGGFPMAATDRVVVHSPGFDTMSALWEERSLQYTPIELKVSASRSVSNSDDINVTATYNFVEAPTKEYRMAYMLLSDGLMDNEWEQSNYFVNKTEKYMEWFNKAGSKVKGLVYNDVLTMRSSFSGEVGSIPADAVPYVEGTHNYTFHTANVLSNQKYDLVKAAGENLRVVAYVVDPATGEVMNAAECGLGEAGVADLNATGKRVVRELYFDLTGKCVAQPEHGLYLHQVYFEDGTFEVHKIIK